MSPFLFALQLHSHVVAIAECDSEDTKSACFVVLSHLNTRPKYRMTVALVFNHVA